MLHENFHETIFRKFVQQVKYFTNKKMLQAKYFTSEGGENVNIFIKIMLDKYKNVWYH